MDPLVLRVEFLEGLVQVFVADVCVPIGGGNIGVAEKLLDDPQIGAVL